MRTKARVYLVLAILAGCIGVAQIIRLGFLCQIFNPLLCLIIFWPAIAFTASYYTTRKEQDTLTHLLSAALCLLAIVFSAGMSFLVEGLIVATTENTNARHYNQIVAERWNRDPVTANLVEHFPQSIPEDAKDVKFSYLPGFLQGGTYIQLRYSTTPEQIETLYKKFSVQKTKSFFGGNTNDHINVKEGMPTTFFYTSDKRGHERFPEDYEIMIFDPVVKEADRPQGFYWNHGICHGVAISKKRNEIVYWAERW